jgi:ATP-dependent DNA ligase
MPLIYQQDKIIDMVTGEIITKDFAPKFRHYNYDEYRAKVKIGLLKHIEPMAAYELNKDELKDYEDGYVAEVKKDGHRAVMHLTKIGNRLFSRELSVKTGWHNETSDLVPHLRDYKIPEQYWGTVLDGEVMMDDFHDVQGVSGGTLPETALQNQIKKGFAKFEVFDIIYYKGLYIAKMPLVWRRLFLARVMNDIATDYLFSMPMYCTSTTFNLMRKMQDEFYENFPDFPLVALPVKLIDNFNSLLQELWDNGEEGIMVKWIKGIYQQKRTRQWMKVKEIRTFDVVIMGYQDSTIYYEGKTLDEKGYWDYWCDAEDEHAIVFERLTAKDADKKGLLPVTKPHAMNWIGAVEVGLYRNGKLVKIAEAKGFKDKDLEYIKKNKKELIGKVIEIKAQKIDNKKTLSLRHPRFSRWRKDKQAKDCKWENYDV